MADTSNLPGIVLQPDSYVRVLWSSHMPSPWTPPCQHPETSSSRDLWPLLYNALASYELLTCSLTRTMKTSSFSQLCTNQVTNIFIRFHQNRLKQNWFFSLPYYNWDEFNVFSIYLDHIVWKDQPVYISGTKQMLVLAQPSPESCGFHIFCFTFEWVSGKAWSL